MGRSRGPLAPCWPAGKKFAFTIIDDTDHATVENTRPLYELLKALGMRTTKTVWVYPPRDGFTGMSLQDGAYRAFLLELQGQGFELALHNVGSGAFAREEILSGLEQFRTTFGHDPALQINHSRNPDNLYWGDRRYSFPLNRIYRLLRPGTRAYSGENSASPHFWGDAAKRRIKYFRNHVFNAIDTLACDPHMPYRVEAKQDFSNYWFSATDAHTLEGFLKLLEPSNQDRLERSGGACIVYTHFACGFVREGVVEPSFERLLRALAARDGWFAPAGTLLDHLLASHAAERVSYPHLLRLDLLWLRDRLLKRLRFGY